MKSSHTSNTVSLWLIASLVVLLVTGVLLIWMGRTIVCRCGYVLLWAGNIWSSDNSQHLFDWYTFSHIIHGFIFYWILWKFCPKWTWQKRLFFAVVIEAGWELLENSPTVINRYREGTISLDYYGDSVINSLMDIVSMIAGFWVSKKLPVWTIVVGILLMELGVGYLIRDNLTLNVLMLIYPAEIIKNWQMAIAP